MDTSDYRVVKRFMGRHFRHFNAAATVDAAQAWVELDQRGDAMMVTLAGAMSTAELGRSLADMIRADKVDAITCTGANLEEDLFNLVAHHHYVRLPNYRDLTPEDEQALLDRQLNRVTDTCIPEEEAMRAVERAVLEGWQRAERTQRRAFPHEYLYELLLERRVEFSPSVDPRDSWLLAAAEKNLPVFVPGWEDSTLGNMFVARHLAGDLERLDAVRSGLEAMSALVDWYRRVTEGGQRIGFFQIGGGIAGDFPICVVPLLHQDLGERDRPLWAYFCQISDSTTSYGSYSGAVPNEKITWGKLDVETPKFVIESDATIVAPLIFAWVLASDA